MRHRSSERRRALTLAELLIVITIITIAATLTVPVAVNLARTQRVAGGARAIQAMLHGARAQAVAQRSVHGLRLYDVSPAEADAAQAGVACLIAVPLDGGDTPATRQEPEVLPTGLRVLVYQSGDTSPRTLPQVIWFRPDGTVAASLSAPIRIDLINASDTADTTAIIIRRTGAIEIPD